MRMAEEQMATLNRIVSQTLGFARTLSVPKESDLVDLTEAALRIHQRTIQAKKIHLVEGIVPLGITAEIRVGEMPTGRLEPDRQCPGCLVGRRNSRGAPSQASGPRPHIDR